MSKVSPCTNGFEGVRFGLGVGTVSDCSNPREIHGLDGGCFHWRLILSHTCCNARKIVFLREGKQQKRSKLSSGLNKKIFTVARLTELEDG